MYSVARVRVGGGLRTVYVSSRIETGKYAARFCFRFLLMNLQIRSYKKVNMV